MELLDIVLNFFYPNVCGICEKVCDIPICNNCMNRINKDMVSGRKIYIPNKDKYIDEHIYLFKYNGIIKELLHKYKFNEKSYLYKSFAYLILKNEKIMRLISKYDFLANIPIHKKRKKYRGYDQTELIIKELCKNDKKIKFENNIVIKTKNIKQQSLLNREERKTNIIDAYKINKDVVQKVVNKRILLFDDIFTTGSTANECSKVLKKYKVKKVGILTIAKD